MRIPIHSPKLVHVALVVVFCLILGGAAQPRAALAQDGGGQLLTVTPTMTVDASALTDGKLCVGRTAILPVTVDFQVSAAEGTLGALSVRSVTYSVRTQNSSVASAQAFTNMEDPDASLIPSRIDVTGLAPGSTTITMDATISTETRLELDEDVALPIPRTSRVTASVPVQVVPCRYRVDILSVWNTTLFNAHTLYLYTLSNELLYSTSGTHFENPTSDALRVHWTAAINRIRGCLVSSPRFDDYVPLIRAEMGQENIAVSIRFHEIAPDIPFLMQLCPVPSSVVQGDCPAYPDGHCWVSPHPSVFRWTPHMPEEGLVFPINGGPLRVPQTLTHPDGSAQGMMFIILTPILP